MGTNYYHEIELCDKCHNSERTHIGKSSAGWTFSFQATEDIRSWRDWQARLEAGGRIVSEYGEKCTLDDFKNLIAAKQKPWGKDGELPYNHAECYPTENFLDPEGHSFSKGEFS